MTWGWEQQWDFPSTDSTLSADFVFLLFFLLLIDCYLFYFFRSNLFGKWSLMICGSQLQQLTFEKHKQGQSFEANRMMTTKLIHNRINTDANVETPPPCHSFHYKIDEIQCHLAWQYPVLRFRNKLLSKPSAYPKIWTLKILEEPHKSSRNSQSSSISPQVSQFYMIRQLKPLGFWEQ